MEPIRVLSLFDGISCGQLALQRAGIPVAVYYASEIEKASIQVTQKNFPDTIHLGDVTKIDFNKYAGQIDLLMGGSPCQDLSMAGARAGLDGEKSGLFFKYLEALRIIKPKYFLLENNVGMPQAAYEKISELMGCYPVEINSALVSAQERRRFYWTNIGPKHYNLFGFPTCAIPQPEDKQILLKDILEKEVEEKYFFTCGLKNVDLSKQTCAFLDNGQNYDMRQRVFNPAFKVGTLTCCTGGNHQNKVLVSGRARKMTPLEYERAQTLPDNYTACVSNTGRYNACGNGWTVDVIAHIFSFIPKEVEK